jgi:hypothetical protein
MLPFGVTIPATVPQGSEIPEGLMNNPVYKYVNKQTNSKQQGYSGEASQQIVHISCKTKLHFSAHKNP